MCNCMKKLSIHSPYKNLTLLATLFVNCAFINNVFASNVISVDTQSIVSRIDALSDPSNKISPEFKIPTQLKQRTAFWYDIYTLYGERDHVVHHTLYPWIVYKVINTKDIYDSQLHRWTKYHKEKKTVAAEVREIRIALRNLSKKTSYKKLKGLEKTIFDKLSSLPGSRRKVIREAAENLRIQLGQKDFLISGIKNSTKYLPHIEAALEDAGLPVELARLPFVESSFNVDAESRVGASGIWQIMPVTGKSFLIVSDAIDERNSPLKATYAAAQILKQNYKSLKNWPLAVTAYNHGVGGVRSAMRQSKTDNLPDLIDKYHQGSFRFASANFYSSFLAVLHAQKYKLEVFKNYPLEFSSALETHVVLLDRPMRFNNLVASLGLNRDLLIEYNLDLKVAAENNARIPRGYKLILPAETKQKIQDLISSGRSQFKSASLPGVPSSSS